MKVNLQEREGFRFSKPAQLCYRRRSRAAPARLVPVRRSPSQIRHSTAGAVVSLQRPADRRHGAPNREDDMRRQRCGRGARDGGHTRLPKVRTAAPPSSAYRRRDYAAAHRLFLPLAEAGDDDTETNCSDASKAKACSETLLSRSGGFRRGCDPGGHPSPIQQGAAGAAVIRFCGPPGSKQLAQGENPMTGTPSRKMECRGAIS